MPPSAERGPPSSSLVSQLASPDSATAGASRDINASNHAKKRRLSALMLTTEEESDAIRDLGFSHVIASLCVCVLWFYHDIMKDKHLNPCRNG